MKLITHLATFDNIDDRRELHCQLSRLPPADRIRFVRWAISRTKPLGNKHPRLHLDARSRDALTAATATGCPRADERITTEMWSYLIILTAQWELPLDVIANALEAAAKRGRFIPPPMLPAPPQTPTPRPLPSSPAVQLAG